MLSFLRSLNQIIRQEDHCLSISYEDYQNFSENTTLKEEFKQYLEGNTFYLEIGFTDDKFEVILNVSNDAGVIFIFKISS